MDVSAIQGCPYRGVPLYMTLRERKGRGLRKLETRRERERGRKREGEREGERKGDIELCVYT